MKKIKKLMHHPLMLMKDVTTKRVIKQFAVKYHLVYFGFVDPREDEHELVRGITVSTSHIDNHYTVGSFNGHDITVVERRNKITYPGKAAQEYHWLIMQFDLKRDKLPHIFIDAHHHEATFYANLLIAFSEFENVTGLLTHVDHKSAQGLKVFAAHKTMEHVTTLLQPQLLSTLAHHFNQFDYEIDDDRLYIYSSNSTVSPVMLNDMLRVGLWLTEQLNGHVQINDE